MGSIVRKGCEGAVIGVAALPSYSPEAVYSIRFARIGPRDKFSTGPGTPPPDVPATLRPLRAVVKKRAPQLSPTPANRT